MAYEKSLEDLTVEQLFARIDTLTNLIYSDRSFIAEEAYGNLRKIIKESGDKYASFVYISDEENFFLNNGEEFYLMSESGRLDAPNVIVIEIEVPLFEEEFYGAVCDGIKTEIVYEYILLRDKMARKAR